MNKYLKYLGIVFILSLIAFLLWALTPLGPDNTISLESDEEVKIEVKDSLIIFTPLKDTPKTGFIFYPGGRVDYRSYANLMYKIARNGYLCVIVKMPLSLAIFGINKANNVIDKFPSIEKWFIGGHSLGGAMAAEYVYKNPDKVDGLILAASYQSSNTDLSLYNLKVLMIYGSMDNIEENVDFNILPEYTNVVIIEGGNHAQFGNYGKQSGDLDATITTEEQHNKIVQAIILFIE